ncbi:hypothetical protein EBR25_07220 [bacterium]|nr:hypothetical protein [bacterium]
MNRYKKRSTQEQDHGYALISILLLMSLGLLIGAGMIDSASSNTRTRALVKTRSEYYYEVEETLNRTVSWLQDNSKYIVDAFSAENFSDNFDLGSPALGDNEGEFFGVYSMVKMKGTNNSVMLTNNTFFGTPTFPELEHIDTSEELNAIQSFQDTDLGSANARVILIWARETNENYEPIFRIDVVTGNNPDRGVHSFSYVYSTLVADSSDMGFYGQNHMTNGTKNECYSFEYTHNGATWDRGAQKANCPVGSNNTISLQGKINGNARSLSDPGVTLLSPGGDVSGTVCEGAGCHTYSLPVLSSWSSYCSSDNGDLAVNTDTTLASGGCWRDISISNNNTLYLTDTSAPYYFRTLDFGPNKAKFDIGTVPVGQKVRVYVETLSNGHINGNEFYNSNNAPHQLEIYYLGSDTIRLNGTADINSVLYASNADIDVLGNFNYYGGIFAKSLDVSGSALFFYDEALGALPALSDMNFSVRKASTRYR